MRSVCACGLALSWILDSGFWPRLFWTLAGASARSLPSQAAHHLRRAA